MRMGDFKQHDATRFKTTNHAFLESENINIDNLTENDNCYGCSPVGCAMLLSVVAL